MKLQTAGYNLIAQTHTVSTSSMATDILENSRISPRPGGPSELSLPLVFFDMVWYNFAANQSLLFFEFPCSKPHFLNTILPHLKNSLSLALSHFLPLAGNIIHPLNPNDKPLIRYLSTDSVSFTVSESDADFSRLTGNQPRDCDEYYSFAPFLPQAARSDASISCPVMALQVTLFPEKGLSIGFVTHHAVGDASSVVSFIRAWAMISKIGPDEGNIEARLAEAGLLPFLDRKTVMNINGPDSVYWEEKVKSSSSVEPPPMKFPINRVRATFLLTRDEIEKLKKFVMSKSNGGVAHVSSFTVVCALVWACSARAAASGGEEVAEDEVEYFTFVADCRGRLSPPLPAEYFGNCVAIAMAELKHGQVKGDDGFVTAAEAMGTAVKGLVSDKKGILDGAAEVFVKVAGKRFFGVAGSPRFDFYATDFGWGKPKKLETLFIDGGRSISLFKSRDFDGGLEIGVSKPKLQMEAFATVFNQLLSDLPH